MPLLWGLNKMKHIKYISILILFVIIFVAPSVYSANTTQLNSGGTQLNPNGTQLNSNGTQLYPGGTQFNDQGGLQSGGEGLSYTNNPTDTCGTVKNIGGIICKMGAILNSIVPLLVALGLVYFVFGVVTYMIGDSEEAKKKGRDKIVYGIIGFVVIFSLWGLVSLTIKTFGLDSSSSQIATNFINNTKTIGGGGSCSLPTNGAKVGDLFKYVTCTIFDSVVPLMFAVAIVMFIWGIVSFFIIGADEEAKREKGKQFMIWGIISLTAMVSIWGLVNIVGGTFNIKNAIPKVQE